MRDKNETPSVHIHSLDIYCVLRYWVMNYRNQLNGDKRERERERDSRSRRCTQIKHLPQSVYHKSISENFDISIVFEENVYISVDYIRSSWSNDAVSRKLTLVVTAATIVTHTHTDRQVQAPTRRKMDCNVIPRKTSRVHRPDRVKTVVRKHLRNFVSLMRLYLTDIHNNNKTVKYLLFIARRVYDILKQCPRHCYIKKRLRKNPKFLTYETVRILHNVSYICHSICQLINLRWLYVI